MHFFSLRCVLYRLRVFQDAFPMFQTYRVGDFTEFMVVGDMVFKFPARLKGYGIYNKMIMDIGKRYKIGLFHE